MGYYEAWMICGGALAEEFECDESEKDLLTQWLSRAKKETFYLAETVELYGRFHGHDAIEGECLCSQMETDHNPMWRNINSRRAAEIPVEEWGLDEDLEAQFLGIENGKQG